MNKQKTKLVDFSSLSDKELKELDRKWTGDAMKFEIRLDSAIRFKKPDKDVQHLYDTANKFWRRIRALNKFMASK